MREIHGWMPLRELVGSFELVILYFGIQSQKVKTHFNPSLYGQRELLEALEQSQLQEGGKLLLPLPGSSPQAPLSIRATLRVSMEATCVKTRLAELAERSETSSSVSALKSYRDY